MLLMTHFVGKLQFIELEDRDISAMFLFLYHENKFQKQKKINYPKTVIYLIIALQ
jgi:hypothetical protein